VIEHLNSIHKALDLINSTRQREGRQETERRETRDRGSKREKERERERDKLSSFNG
jgi:hypothetical protein